MAGLFGFFVRTPRPREWMAERLEVLRGAVVRRADHRHHLEIHDAAAFGISGPGLLAGNLVPYAHASGAVMLAEGEVYRAGAWTSAHRPFEEAWPSVLDRWITGGADALATVDGLYCLARYDPHAATGPSLTLVNDRYGSRRLFVLEDDDAVVFAADFAPLVAWLGPRLELDPTFIEESICMASPLGNRTWSRQIRLFPPATCLTVTPAGVRERRYWNWSSMPAAGTHSGTDAGEQVFALWRDAMSLRLKGDGLGQMLSGGLDSRLILGEATARLPDWLSVTYGEPGSDEVRFAERSARAAGSAWQFWPLPGDRWLERRVALSLENGGMVDLLNAHHTGLVTDLRGRLRFELSGYLGDVVMGDSYAGMSVEQAMWKLPYWTSPVSVDPAIAFGRIAQDIGSRDPWIWMMETKLRRMINNWPHLAVNDLEVRKPFMDYALVEFCAGLPPRVRRDSALHVRLLERHYPALARVPIQRTGVRPGAPRAAYFAMGAVRRTYRVVRAVAARFGLPLGPWVRGAVDIGRWLADPAVQQEIRGALLDPSARITRFVDRGAIAATLRQTFQESVAHEIALNLYRIERVLRHFHW